MKTLITKQLIEKGYEIQEFYSSGLALTRSGNGYEVVATVGEEAFEVSVRDVDAREIVSSIDFSLDIITLETFENIMKVAESRF